MENRKNYLYYDAIVAAFVAVLLISNIASTKIVAWGKFSFDGGTILFPLSYIFGDILTEVYGYRKSRRVVWMGFFAAALLSFLLFLVQILPADPAWPLQSEYEKILGFTWRIVLASLLAFWVGEFANSYLLAKLKVYTQGKHLWVRTISSTLVGQLLDTLIFCTIAFYGIYPTETLVAIVVSNYIFKCSIEILFTPLTYKIVSFLKHAEGEDAYDRNTNFNPFVW